MKLDELIEHLDYKDLVNFKNVEVTGISYNSKTTKKGDIFICLTGEYTDGHEYAQNAIENGAVALLTEHTVEAGKTPQIVVSSTRHKIADIADRFYSSPSKGINLIGITGTNGKTTVTTVQNILDQLLPGLLALVLTLVVSKLLKKNISPIAIIFILFAVGIVGYGLGILA